MNNKLHTIIDEGLDKEIEATIHYELKWEYTDNEIAEYVQYEGLILEKIKKN